MQEESERTIRGSKPRIPGGRGKLTRREVLAGAAMAALAVGSSGALAAPVVQTRRPMGRGLRAQLPLRRYMAAAAALGDGRILVTGGYDRPWKDGQMPPALNSVAIFEPSSGQWFAAAPMSMPRARHAAVALPDGRIAVIGGMGMNPTASVEIYDPRTDSWQLAAALSQPRYDHMAALCGGQICVLGGSCQSIMSSAEFYDPSAAVGSVPNH